MKLALLIALLLMLTTTLVGAVLLRQEEQSLSAEMEKRGLTIARDLADGAKQPIVAGDELTLSLLTQEVMRDPEVVYVAIATEDGRIVAHSDLELIGKPLAAAGLATVETEARVRPFTDARGGSRLDVAVPLVFSRVPVGGIYLGFGRDAIDRALHRARRETLLISAVMVGVGIAGAVGLSAVLTRPVLRLAQGTRAVAGGDFGVSVPVTSRDEIGVLTASFNQMTKSLHEKEMIKRAFTRYVAREVVDEILRDPERPMLRGERRDVTVLFCDMRGFTSLAERLAPEEVVLLLNEYYDLMIDTTFRNGGTLDKFLGDGVMAVFGAPIAHPDHSIRAVRTALAMQSGVAELSRRRVQAGKDPIAVGIGVSAGEAVTGTVGTQDRMEYAVIGESVTEAARLQATARPGQVLISRRTYDYVPGLVDARPLGPIQIKGEKQPVDVYEVLGLIEAG